MRAHDVVLADYILPLIGVLFPYLELTLISEDTLLGTEMLDGCRLVVDYVAHTVTVSDETN